VPFAGGEGGPTYSYLVQQSLLSAYDAFVDNKQGGLGQVAFFGSPDLSYQYTTVDHDYFTGGKSIGYGPYGDGLYVAMHGGGYYLGYNARSITNSVFSNVGNNGIEIFDDATGYVLSTNVLDRNTVTGAKQAGISITAYGTGPLLYQLVQLDRTTLDGNRYGAQIYAAGYGGATVIQGVSSNRLTARNNTRDGLVLGAAGAGAYTTVAQYADFANGHFDDNGRNGVSLAAYAVDLASVQQSVSISDSTMTGNRTGVQAVAVSAYAGSANQQLVLINDSISNNARDGLDLGGVAAYGGFTTQALVVNAGGEGASRIKNNGRSGVVLSGYAVLGGNVDQNAGIYNTDLRGNGRDGITTETFAYGYQYPTNTPGYAYYSHVTQNLIAGHDNLSDNGRDGINMSNVVGLYAQTNHFVYVYDSAISGNGRNGVYEQSLNNSPDNPFPALTELYSNVYIYNSDISHNAKNGVSINSTTLYPSYLIQRVVLNGDTVNDNGRNGFEDRAAAIGYFSLNDQTIQLVDSTFQENGRDGAYFSAFQYYGLYSFGAAIQDVTISGSTFAGNVRDGVNGSAVATGVQGRVEQNFTILNSQIDSNGRDGLHLYRFAGGGSYINELDCSEVQGLYGGCAFVRQRVAVLYSDISNNARDGVYIGTVATDYGAVYTQSGRPANTTFLAYDSHFDSNGRDGLNLVNNVTADSYLFQYAYLADSSFNSNGRNGVTSTSYVGGASAMLQLLTIYSYAAPVTFNNNGGSGVSVTTTAGAGSVAFDRVLSLGGTFKGNDTAGISLKNVSTGGISLGIAYAYGNTFKDTGFGFNSVADGYGAYQYNYLGYNVFKSNDVAIRGRAKNGGFQYWDLHYGNTVANSNTTKYSFHADGASTIVVNY
jgi:hypothetical protein